MRSQRTAGLLAVILAAVGLALIIFGLLARPVSSYEGCVFYQPKPPNEPTGVAGCEVWGEGTASHYGPGWGVAMNFCTWTRRHTEGCGHVTVTSLETGVSVDVPVVDYCDCYTTTANERIVDLKYDVVAALGLNRSAGLYPVRVQPRGLASVIAPDQPSPPGSGTSVPATTPRPLPAGGQSSLPDTACCAESSGNRSMSDRVTPIRVALVSAHPNGGVRLLAFPTPR